MTAATAIEPRPVQLGERQHTPKWGTALLAVSVLLLVASVAWLVASLVDRNRAHSAASHAHHGFVASRGAVDAVTNELSDAQSEAELRSGDAHQVLDLSQRQLDLSDQERALTRQSIEAFQQGNAARYNALSHQFNPLVDQYNSTVDEFNKLYHGGIGGSL